MVWQVRWGDKLDFLEKNESLTGITPPPLRDQPVFTTDMTEYTYAFYTLNNSRQLGFGIGPIPLQAIWSYIQMFGEPVHGREVFVYLLGQMDQAFITEMGKKHATNT